MASLDITKQINPDRGWCDDKIYQVKGVSIVSIKTDQSRLYEFDQIVKDLRSFNRINPNRSIPTSSLLKLLLLRCWRFNRINPNRSIPTLPGAGKTSTAEALFQSYQSKQINPDLLR